MAITWYEVIDDRLEFGVDWNATVSNTNIKLAPIIYRWDKYDTNNYGGTFDETLSPDPSGAGSWDDLTYGSGQGTRQIDSFGTRTYNRRNGSSFTVTLTLSWSSNTGTFNGSYFQNAGSGSHSWTYTIPALPTYTVSYNANGGSGAPGNQTKTYGVNLTLSSTKPTRSGYTFSKWNTASNGSGTNYSSGGSYTGNANLTLYAQWTPSTYTVSYNANGGSGAPANQTKTAGTALTLSSTIPTWSGHTFKNWNTSQNGSGTAYQPSGSYTTEASVTLYAQWDIDPYIITFNANGGTNAPNPSTKIHGTTLILPTSTPYRGGYTFFRWNTMGDGTGQDYSPGGKFNINAHTTLYAIWIQNTIPKDILHDCYVKTSSGWVPCFAYINVNNVWYFVEKTAVNVSGTWKNASDKT